MSLLLLLMNVMHPCWIKALILIILIPDFWVIQYVLLQMCTVCTGCDTSFFIYYYLFIKFFLQTLLSKATYIAFKLQFYILSAPGTYIIYRFTHLTLVRFMGLSYNSWEDRCLHGQIPWRVLPERLSLSSGRLRVSIKTSRHIQEWVIQTNLQWPVFRHRLPAEREALFLQERRELDCFKSV